MPFLVSHVTILLPLSEVEAIFVLHEPECFSTASISCYRIGGRLRRQLARVRVNTIFLAGGRLGQRTTGKNAKSASVRPLSQIWLRACFRS
jgi:hypothetical protein